MELQIERLRPHQVGLAKHLASIFQHHRTAVDLSPCGAGKTYVSASVASASALPTLVIGPKSSESAWTRAAKHFNDKFSFVNYEQLRYGNTNYGRWDNNVVTREKFFKCQTCQLEVDPAKPSDCYAHPQGIHCIDTLARPAKRGKFNFHPAVRNLVFDEVHRCAAIKSLNADVLIAARRQGIRTTALSATAACSPLGMRGLGYLLDLHNLADFYSWAMRYKCRRDPNIGPGLHWLAGREEQRQIMASIRASIIPERGVYISLDDIPGFPQCDISAELYTVDSAAKIEEIYQQGGLKVTQMLRERQAIELLKLPIFEEVGKDYRAKGYSMVFFVNFQETIAQLQKIFPNAGVISGQHDNCAQVESDFDNNKLRELIVSADAGKESLSLHDRHGDFPRGALVSPNFSAVSMIQLFGRLRREGGKSKSFYRVILADKTVETKVWSAINRKSANIEALNEGDLNPFRES